MAQIFTAALLILAAPAAADVRLDPAAIVVIDGDTFDGPDGARYRLWGVQAPERRHPDGPAATAALRGLLDRAETVACEDTGGRSYGRVVALCRLVGGPFDGADVACLLALTGHAADWPRYSGGLYAACEGRTTP